MLIYEGVFRAEFKKSLSCLLCSKRNTSETPSSSIRGDSHRNRISIGKINHNHHQFNATNKIDTSIKLSKY